MEIIKKYFNNLSEKQIEQLGQLEELYRFWNENINVISRKDLDALYERHVLHSLSIAKVFNFEKSMHIVDIGTGGGFPGIPLSILFPESHFTLADSIGKKIKVTKQVAASLNLENVTAFHGRVEECRGVKFDLAVTRAVAPLAQLGQWSKKVLKNNNQGLICLKGGDLKKEINESGLKTQSWNISDFFSETFFETKKVTWSEIYALKGF